MRKPKKPEYFKMTDFNIDKNLIKADLSEYINFAENNLSIYSKFKILCDFETIEDYVYILYYLRFEKQLGYTEIGKSLYPSSKNFHQIAYMSYFLLGLNYNLNYDETKQWFINEQKKLKQIKEKSYILTLNELKLTQEQIKEYNIKLENYKTKDSGKRTFVYKRLNYDSIENYFKAFYYFKFVCELSTYQISKMFMLSANQILARLKNMGLDIDMQTSQKQAVKHNRRNYSNTLLAGRKTMNNYMIKNACYGSISENVVRNKMAINLAGHINNKIYEVVVGINNKTIIAPKEIDIPIIIINTLNRKILKVAVELNAEVFHKDEIREESKIGKLNNKEWLPYFIWFTNNKRKQEKLYGSIDHQINTISIDIKNKLENI